MDSEMTRVLVFAHQRSPGFLQDICMYKTLIYYDTMYGTALTVVLKRFIIKDPVTLSV